MHLVTSRRCLFKQCDTSDFDQNRIQSSLVFSCRPKICSPAFCASALYCFSLRLRRRSLTTDSMRALRPGMKRKLVVSEEPRQSWIFCRPSTNHLNFLNNWRKDGTDGNQGAIPPLAIGNTYQVIDRNLEPILEYRRKKEKSSDRREDCYVYSCQSGRLTCS